MPKKEELIEIIKKRFGTSDEDLHDLDVVMTSLDGIDRAEYLEQELANQKLESEKALKELDQSWRERYRERFFSGETEIDSVVEKLEREEEEDDGASITIDEYLESIEKEERK